MNKKPILFIITLAFIAFITLLTLGLIKPTIKKTSSSSVAVTDQAVANAKALFKQYSSEGWDMSNGPCLSNDLMPGWVADVVHTPRIPDDDKSQNQCPAYLEGRAVHFVELDTAGDLVRVR